MSRGRWPPRFKAKNKPKRKWVRIAAWGDYLRAMIDRHGSVEAWQAARDAELAAAFQPSTLDGWMDREGWQ
jgi:hypothetical protein